MDEKPVTQADLAQAVREIKAAVEAGSKSTTSFWTGALLGAAIGLALLRWLGML